MLYTVPGTCKNVKVVRVFNVVVTAVSDVRFDGALVNSVVAVATTLWNSLK